MMRTFTCIVVSIVLASCGNKKTPSAEVLGPDKMKAVLWDVIKADAFTSQFILRDSSKNAVEENLKLQQEIFAIHKTTKEEFYRSYDYYKKNNKEFKAILDSMISQAERSKPGHVTTKQEE